MYEESGRMIPPLEEGNFERNRRRKSWIARGVVAVVLAGAAFFGFSRYGRPAWQEHKGMLSSVSTLGERISATEDGLRNWVKDRDSLREKISEVEDKARANFISVKAQAQKQTQEMTGQIERRLRAELDQRAGQTNARIDQIQSAQEAESARLARLQQEIAAVRGEVATQVAAARDQSMQDVNGLNRRLAGLDNRVEQDSRGLKTVARKLDRRRIDFELTQNQSQELAPGVTVRLTKVNPAYRRVEGWMWLMPDRRTVWIRGHGPQQPLTFYSKEDARPYEFVITDVRKKTALGYLVMPNSAPGDAAIARN